MSDIPGTTRQQTNFLRALRKQPSTLGNVRWPNAVTFRRWLRREGFRRALESILDALRVQSDIQLAAVAAAATQNLQGVLCGESEIGGDGTEQIGASSTTHPTVQIQQIQSLVSLIRMAHLRQRYAPVGLDEPDDQPAPPLEAPCREISQSHEYTLRLLRRFKPDRPISDALQVLEAWIVGRKLADRSALRDEWRSVLAQAQMMDAA